MRSYIEVYASRRHDTRLSQINSRIGVNQRTVDRWLEGDDFRAELDAIDRLRKDAALKAYQAACTAWPAIIEEQCEIARCSLEPPPDLTGLNHERAQAVAKAYVRRQEVRAGLAVRAATLIARVLRLLNPPPAHRQTRP